VNRRFLLGASVAALVAGVAGVVLGLGLKQNPKPAKTARPFFVASSQYVHRTKKKVDFRVISGAIKSAPRWPVMIVTDADAGRHAKPWVVTGDMPNGPLRIVEGSPGTVLVRAKNGYTYSLEEGYEDNGGGPNGATLYSLGKRLDPRNLPSLSKLGVAVPVQYGKDAKRRAVILVGIDKYISSPHIYGYLPGFSLASKSPDLDRLLLGPDRALYRIDSSARHLELVAKPLASREPWIRNGRQQTRCKPWPGGKAGTYYGCPGRIELVRPNGTRTTVFRDNCRNGCSGSAWEVVLPSPDGKTLLVQEGMYLCGGVWSTSLLPASGGKPEAIPAGEFSDSWALGWLDADTALVAARGPGECGPPHSGIYVVDRRYPGLSTLVLATTSDDAVVWRRSK
jgi:hypothetical protein